MHIALQNKIKGLNINYIQFSPKQASTSKNKHTPQNISNQVLVYESVPNKKICNITRNSFIPTTQIKSRVEFEKEKKHVVKPLNPAEMTYSKFPKRKPLSAKSSHISFPVYRERIYSFCNNEVIDLRRSNFVSAHEKKIKSVSCMKVRRSPEDKERVFRNKTICMGRYKWSEKDDQYTGKWSQLQYKLK